MKILLVGVFSVENSTNNFMAKAFRKVGHTVVEFDYRFVSSRIGPGAMNAGLAYEVIKENPDLVIICKGDQIGIDTILKINETTRTFYWYPDPPITTSLHFTKLASACTYASCTGLGVAKLFVANGVNNVFHIFEGVDSEYYYPVSKDPYFETNISFIGSRTSERMEYLYTLGATEIVRVYGNGFGLNSNVQGENFRKICSSSKIMLSINTQNDVEEYFSDRVFLYLACNAFVFQKYTPGLENYFENGKHLVWFRDVNELIALTKEYLDPKKDNDRIEIAKEGREHVLNNFTWDIAIRKILEQVR